MSRTYVFAKRGASTSQTSYEIRGSDLRLLKSPSVGSTEKRSTGPFSYAVSPRLALILCPKTGTFRYIKVSHCGSLDIRPCGLRHGVSVGGTLCLRLFFVQMDVQVMTWLQNEATTPPPSGNLYPNRGNRPKRVENPVVAIRKSLPKQRKSAEKGRDSCSRHSEISTQIGEISRKGRDSHYCRPEISTQNAEKRRSFNKTKKADRQVRFDGW